MKDAIRLGLTRLDVLDLLLKFRLVGWRFRPWQAAGNVLECSMARALIDLRRRHLAIDDSFQRDRRDVDCIRPVSAQVRMAVSRTANRRRRASFGRRGAGGRRRFLLSERQTGDQKSERRKTD